MSLSSVIEILCNFRYGEKSIFIEDMFCFMKSKPLSAIKSSGVKRAGFDET